MRKKPLKKLPELFGFRQIIRIFADGFEAYYAKSDVIGSTLTF